MALRLCPNFDSGMIIYSGAVVDRLHVNGISYGRPKGGKIRSIEIGPEETITELQYHKTAWWWEGTMCSFTLVTDVNTYHVGGFEEWKAENPNGRYGYCGSKKFSVQIPTNQDINSFFESEIIYGRIKRFGSNWIIGFKSETEIV